MNKYATPQSVTHDEGGNQVVSAEPMKPCCKETATGMQKRAAERGQPCEKNCQCGNHIEVSRE